MATTPIASSQPAPRNQHHSPPSSPPPTSPALRRHKLNQGRRHSHSQKRPHVISLTSLISLASSPRSVLWLTRRLFVVFCFAVMITSLVAPHYDVVRDHLIHFIRTSLTSIIRTDPPHRSALLSPSLSNGRLPLAVPEGPLGSPNLTHLTDPSADPTHLTNRTRIIFASCNRPIDKVQPIWVSMASRRPYLFVWTGDAVYADKELPVYTYLWLKAKGGVIRILRSGLSSLSTIPSALSTTLLTSRLSYLISLTPLTSLTYASELSNLSGLGEVSQILEPREMSDVSDASEVSEFSDQFRYLFTCDAWAPLQRISNWRAAGLDDLRREWSQLSEVDQGYRLLREGGNDGGRRPHIIGTWDDHDYGGDNSDRRYPYRKQSMKMFLDFLEEPTDSPRREQQGVYSTNEFLFQLSNGKQKSVRVILLDTRYNKHEWDIGPSGDFLGEAQWRWLENVLNETTSDVNVIVSSLQVLVERPFVEQWSLFPQSFSRLMSTVLSSNAKAPFFVSGDVHFAEIGEVRCFPEISEAHTASIWKASNLRAYSQSDEKQSPHSSRSHQTDDEEATLFPLPTVRMMEMTSSGITHHITDEVGFVPVWIFDKFTYHSTVKDPYTGKNDFYWMNNFGEVEFYWSPSAVDDAKLATAPPDSPHSPAPPNSVEPTHSASSRVDETYGHWTPHTIVTEGPSEIERLELAMGERGKRYGNDSATDEDVGDVLAAFRVYNSAGLVTLSHILNLNELGRSHKFEHQWRAYVEALKDDSPEFFSNSKSLLTNPFISMSSHSPHKWVCLPHRGTPGGVRVTSELRGGGALSQWIVCVSVVVGLSWLVGIVMLIRCTMCSRVNVRQSIAPNTSEKQHPGST
eukprot:GHVN01041260.1.p1 GENE.GHVN01041260.1~~GHVN01041260.1.p1  ORF type:complete len:856 (-),score=221.49 GHVN01041260.1:548-3115(-)